ncbi:MAG TPA: hypothetical protein VMD59_13105, partial [Acidimicrobiales bacterium]|nr:hypothetical protein [Acidimicrobiales bacterium]
MSVLTVDGLPRERSQRLPIPPFTVLVSFGFLALVVVLAVFGSLIFPGSPSTQHLFDTSRTPSATYWFGTDELGRNVFLRVVNGCRTALVGPSLIAASGLVVSS